MTKCLVDYCNTECPHPGGARGMCRMHYKRWKRYGDPNKVFRSPAGHGTVTARRYVRYNFRDNNMPGGQKAIYEHIMLAEAALGRPLPKGAHVHHMNGNGLDNQTPWNLVICPSDEYHKLLHKRSKELGYL